MNTQQTEACITAIAGPRVKPNAEQTLLLRRVAASERLSLGAYVCDAVECLTATYLVALGWLTWGETGGRQIEITAAGREVLGEAAAVPDWKMTEQEKLLARLQEVRANLESVGENFLS